MCGIAGILRFDGASPSADALRAMGHALAHRGPDGDGVVAIGPCGLAHRRLAIIDLSPAGRQPMSTEDGASVARFFRHPGASFNRRTLFRGIDAVEPGTSIRISADGSMEPSRYWHFLPSARPLDIGLGEASERVRTLLTDAVRIRFRSD